MHKYKKPKLCLFYRLYFLCKSVFYRMKENKFFALYNAGVNDFIS